jgi:hypothetical protein
MGPRARPRRQRTAGIGREARAQPVHPRKDRAVAATLNARERDELLADSLRISGGNLYGAHEWLNLIGTPEANGAIRRIAHAWCRHYRETGRAASRIRLDGLRIVVTRDRRAG